MALKVRNGDFSDPRVIGLLERHLERARAETAPGSAHALDLTGLQEEGVYFWTLWDAEMLVGMGATKRLSEDHYEVKSMHTIEGERRRGYGRTMLDHLEKEAAKRGAQRLSLETGSWEYFLPAVAFYQRAGFVECGPFANYKLDPNSIFMTKLLA